VVVHHLDAAEVAERRLHGVAEFAADPLTVGGLDVRVIGEVQDNAELVRGLQLGIEGGAG
jgi:hypothetical protein